MVRRASAMGPPCKVLVTTRLCFTMIRNLEMDSALVGDIADPEATMNLMTNALDLYCDRLISGTKQRVIHPDMVDYELEAVITEAILDANPHLRDKFEFEFSHEEGSSYNVSINIRKSTVQQHMESVSGSILCH